MKKLLIACVLLVAAGALFAADSGEFEMSIGLDFPTIGLGVETNNAGQIVAVRGINLALGYSAKHYFEPVELDAFNPFWHWGTVLILLPYIGIGADYVTESGFYFTIGTIYLAPYVGFGLYF